MKVKPETTDIKEETDTIETEEKTETIESKEKPEEKGKPDKKEKIEVKGQTAKTGERRQPETVDTAVSQQFTQRRIYFRRKVCKLCVKKVKEIDYKDIDLLRRFVTERGKILPRRITGTCAKHQRILAMAIKRARFIALLPFEANK
ncbi:MAG: 30S ribosomal protein S18 [Spirochaetota bacterium]|nr:MAG: 30S ribosomal protein S18 [Spirochaetota bacterium]